jgi:hypothetical protein
MEQETKNDIGEWIFCFVLASIFMWIGRMLFKPFEESNLFFKFLGILSIVFLLFVVFMVGLTAFGSNPISALVLILPGSIYVFFAIVAYCCHKVEE